VKVLFMPDYSAANPYQRELAAALRKAGVAVIMANGTTPLSILELAKGRDRPDIVHLHWPEVFWIVGGRRRSAWNAVRFLGTLLVLKARGVRLVWTIHNLVEHERRHVRLEYPVNAALARLCDGLIVHCEHARQAAKAAFHLSAGAMQRTAIIPHGHYMSVYKNEMSRAAARAALQLDEEGTVFLYLGNIKPYKALDTLITAFRALSAPTLRLMIVGRPVKRIQQDVQAWCAQDERISARLEFVADDEVQVYMNAADVVVLPYANILTSGTLLLAMSFAKAVIAPRIGCLPEVVDFRGGFFYEPGNSAALTGALRQALSADLTEMGLHNQRIVQKYDWDTIAAGTREVYARALA
jgi:glycosyltransferase involved in cell wall biosynthesis